MSSATSTEQLLPWTKGPFELIRHSVGHMNLGGDTDRRLALIGFDNAVEVCIDVFMRLHPSLRNGYVVSKAFLDSSTNNFHNKVDWFSTYIQEKNIELGFYVDQLRWYHSLRNELYHSGNGMIPEKHVIEGAYKCAISVFSSLFGQDIANILDITEGAHISSKSLADDEVIQEFKYSYDYMALLLSDLIADLLKEKPNKHRSLLEMWGILTTIFNAGSSFNDMLVNIEAVKFKIDVKKPIDPIDVANADEDLTVLQRLIYTFQDLSSKFGKIIKIN